MSSQLKINYFLRKLRPLEGQISSSFQDATCLIFKRYHDLWFYEIKIEV